MGEESAWILPFGAREEGETMKNVGSYDILFSFVVVVENSIEGFPWATRPKYGHAAVI